MILTELNLAQEGDVLAKTIFSKSGSVLLESGTKLTSGYIKKLKTFGIRQIYIQFKPSKNVHTPPAHSKSSFKDSHTSHKVGILTARQIVLDHFRKLLASSVIESRIVNTDEIGKYRACFQDVVDTICSTDSAMKLLSQLVQKDLQLFERAVQVFIYSLILGIARNYDRDERLALGFGALLYDIGMLDVPDHILQKKEPLEDREKHDLRDHAVKGYHMLRSYGDIPGSAALCALQHHERYSGQGYPRALKAGEIHDHAQIVSLSDVYNALVSKRIYRSEYPPTEALEFLFGRGGYWFDIELIRQFVANIRIFPLKSMVELSTGQIGIVLSTPYLSYRPMVKIIKEGDGTLSDPPYPIDLQNHLDIMIRKVL